MVANAVDGVRYKKAKRRLVRDAVSYAIYKAVREGFEPTDPFQGHSISSRAPSTAQPSHQRFGVIDSESVG